MANVTNITVSGLGGQGVLKVTDILAEVLFRAGYDVKKSEVHGMSQRGGSVSSEVRFGDEVASPMVPEGESDFLVVLDPTQIEVNLHKLKSPKALNIMMLGALSGKFPAIGEELWLEVVKAFLPQKLHEMNIEMFRLGRGN